MSDRVPALIGFALFAAFVGYLAFSIAEVPFALIVAAVVAMAAFDFWGELRGGG